MEWTRQSFVLMDIAGSRDCPTTDWPRAAARVLLVKVSQRGKNRSFID
jgi:hypothetical protein